MFFKDVTFTSLLLLTLFLALILIILGFILLMVNTKKYVKLENISILFIRIGQVIGTIIFIILILFSLFRLFKTPIFNASSFTGSWNVIFTDGHRTEVEVFKTGEIIFENGLFADEGIILANGSLDMGHSFWFGEYVKNIVFYDEIGYNLGVLKGPFNSAWLIESSLEGTEGNVRLVRALR